MFEDKQPSAVTFLRTALIPSFHSERLHGGNCERYGGDIDRIVPRVRRACVSRQANPKRHRKLQYIRDRKKQCAIIIPIASRTQLLAL